MPTPSRLLVGITGYGANCRRDSGLEDLLLKAYRQSNSTLIDRFVWNDDSKGIACWIRRIREKFKDVPTFLVGHSYGGFTCSLVAEHLRQMEIPVEALFLCDAVWRRHPRIAMFRSMFGRGEIYVPGNVRRLYSWRQSADRIRGASIVVESQRTLFVVDDYVDWRHAEIDSYPYFHDVVLKELSDD